MKITKDRRTNLEKVIDEALEEMKGMNPANEDYTKMAENIERLYKAKACERPHRISPDVLATILANVGIAVLILNYEKLGVISTKTLSFLLKGRV